THGVTTHLELGPGGTLTALAQEATDPDTHTTHHPTLRHHHPEPHALTTALAALHVHGTPVNWHTYHHTTTHPVDLPTYAFQRQHYWP
ncbi:hypothetical protein, partial [Streptomyces sp. JWR5-1]